MSGKLPESYRFFFDAFFFTVFLFIVFFFDAFFFTVFLGAVFFFDVFFFADFFEAIFFFGFFFVAPFLACFDCAGSPRILLAIARAFAFLSVRSSPRTSWADASICSFTAFARRTMPLLMPPKRWAISRSNSLVSR